MPKRQLDQTEQDTLNARLRLRMFGAGLNPKPASADSIEDGEKLLAAAKEAGVRVDDILTAFGQTQEPASPKAQQSPAAAPSASTGKAAHTDVPAGSYLGQNLTQLAMASRPTPAASESSKVVAWTDVPPGSYLAQNLTELARASRPAPAAVSLPDGPILGLNLTELCRRK